MSSTAKLTPGLSPFWLESFSWLAGGAITAGLLLGLARFDHPAEPPPEIEELHLVSLPADVPPTPPSPAEPVATAEEAMPLIGIDAGASDSSVHLRSLPVDFENLLPHTALPPKQLDLLGRIRTDPKPRVPVSVEVNRIYQESEVDQVPRAVVRTVPITPKDLFGRSDSLMVVLLLTIDRNGLVENVRVSQTSKQPLFDEIVARTVREQWEFSPAIRRGKPVRCLAEQSFRVRLPGGSPFNVE